MDFSELKPNMYVILAFCLLKIFPTVFVRELMEHIFGEYFNNIA